MRPSSGGPLLLVCRANLVRSPLVQELVAQALRQHGRDDLEVCSAGLEVLVDGVPDPAAVEAARELGCDLSSREAVPVTPEMIEHSGLVVTMTERQRSTVLRLSHHAVPKTFTLPELARLIREIPGPASDWADLARRAHTARPFAAAPDGPEDVADPAGRGRQDHQATAHTLAGFSVTLVASMLRD